MATSYTTNLGLALPVTSELAGTWGDVVNQEITELLDNAIAGTTTLSSDADVTLTTTTGAANEARQAILLWTANGTATRTITAPARTKAYIVINATGSTQSIKLVGAGPTTGITIVAGERCLAAWNGSDFVKVASSVADGVTSVSGTGSVNGITLSGTVTSTGNLTLGGTLSNVNLTSQVTGTLPLGNGGTGQTTAQAAINSLAGAVTSGQYLRGNGTNVVMSAIQAADVPTLNQNTTGTASNVTGTVAIANGGTGATTAANARTNLGGTTVGQSYFTLTNPSAITFPRMNADNTVSALSAADFRTAIGAGTGTGTVTSVAVSGGTTGLTTSGGPITGSGTITLAGTLGVANGGTGLTSFTANGVVYASSTSALTTGSGLQFDGSNLGLGVTPSAWGSNYRAVELAGISVSGTTTGGTASISQNSYYNGTNWIYKTSSTAVLYQQGAGDSKHIWFTAPSGTAGNPITFTQAMTLTASGNLGIGLTNPASKLSVGGNPPTSGVIAGVAAATGVSLALSDNTNSSLYVKHPSAGVAIIGTDPGGQIAFATNGFNEAARIDASGNFGIGLTPSGSYKLEVSGTAAATDFNSTSDRNKKTNIATIQHALDKVQFLRGVEFDWKDTGKHSVGLIAQEVEAVIPEAVQGEEGNKTVSYGNLVGLLIEAIKEQQQQISTLKAEVAALKGA